MAPFDQQQLHRISRVVETVKSATRSLESLHEIDAMHDLCRRSALYQLPGSGCTPCAGGNPVEGGSPSMAILGVRSTHLAIQTSPFKGICGRCGQTG